jgi:hypothetical protein
MRVPHLCKVGMNLIVSRKTTWKILPNVKKEKHSDIEGSVPGTSKDVIFPARI